MVFSSCDVREHRGRKRGRKRGRERSRNMWREKDTGHRESENSKGAMVVRMEVFDPGKMQNPTFTYFQGENNRTNLRSWGQGRF